MPHDCKSVADWDGAGGGEAMKETAIVNALYIPHEAAQQILPRARRSSPICRDGVI